MKELRLYLIRHGETESPSLICGHLDLDLSDRGRQQAIRLAQLMISIPIVAVYSSDLRRAFSVAEMIARPHGIAVCRAPDLREINMGRWEGESLGEICRLHPDMIASLCEDPRRFRYPEGESFADFEARVLGALKRILAEHERGDVVVVAHGGVCRVVLGKVMGLEPSFWLRLAQDYGCINVIEWCQGLPLIKRINYPVEAFI